MRNINMQAAKSVAVEAGGSATVKAVKSVWHKEKIDGKKIAQELVQENLDKALKSVVNEGLKRLCQQEIVQALTKGQASQVLKLNLASIAVDSIKTTSKVATGKLSATEGVCTIAHHACSTVLTTKLSSMGTAWGMALGAPLGPVGMAAGGLVGGTVASYAGSKALSKGILAASKVKAKLASSSISLSLSLVARKEL